MNHRNMKAVFIILLFLSSSFLAQAQESVFERKRQEYIQSEGSNLNRFCERIWAWLEKLKNGEIDLETYFVKDVDGYSKKVRTVIHNIIRCWGTSWAGDGYPTYTWAWKYGANQSGVMLSWILWQYGDFIDPNDRNFIYNLLNGDFRRRDFYAGNPNSQAADMVTRYLWSQDNQDVEVIYSYDPPPNVTIKEFTWEGRTYIPGQQYNSYELCRDWLDLKIHTWIHSGMGEFDSPIYTWCFVHCFSALYEWANDPLMKRKAKMMVDFILLDSIMDFAANQWGGCLGRKYEQVFRYSGWDRFYWDIFWDKITPTHEPSRNILISSYRLPDVIFDIGDLSDEPDNYYHINKEFTNGIFCVPETGKWNYVTKFYSLGGGRGNEWQLCIKSEDTPGSYGRAFATPFRLWINNLQPGEDVTKWTFTSGQSGYQYLNAMLVIGNVLHISTGGYSFDVDEEINVWRFLKEGRTMVAIAMDSYASALEVAIEGVDYGSYDEFKQAVLTNAVKAYNQFTTSRGDLIMTRQKQFADVYASYALVKRNGESDFEPVWDFPFSRIEAVDYRGNDLIKWIGNNLIVQKNGKQIVYDFDNWTATESTLSGDVIPPNPPNGVDVQPNE